MPPRAAKGKSARPAKAPVVFEADFASAREKRVTALRTHQNHQFNYREIATPLLADTSEDRNWCHPEQTADKGRVLVADMDFKPGDVIFREKPLVVASWNDYHCHECAKPHKYISCRTFQGIYGRDSFLAKHMVKIEDALLDFGVIGDLDRARLFIKALWLLKLAPDAQCWQEISKLTTAGTMQDEYTICIEQFRRKTYVKESGLIDDSVSSLELTKLLAILNNNSHEIEGYGSGIWLYASLLEHSCTANCNFVTSEEELILVAIKHISAGSPLSIDYNVATYKPNKFRQEHYEAHYGFVCTCAMCTVSFDRPRAFNCPQSIRYYADYLKQLPQLNGVFTKGQFGPEQQTPGLFHTHPTVTAPQGGIAALDTRALSSGGSNLYQDISDHITKVHANQPVTQSQQSMKEVGLTSLEAGSFEKIMTGLYTFNGVQFDLKSCPFLALEQNPSCPPYDSPQAKCIDGIVHPVGDGQSQQLWKCAGCGYILTPQEVDLCRGHERLITPPPNVTQGDTYDDVQELFTSHRYTVPTIQQVNQWVSQGVIHISHTAVYWTLYVLALAWTKKATDACYVLESTATKQSQGVSKNLTGAKKRIANSQAQNVRLTFPEDSLSENDLDVIDFNNRFTLNFFSLNYAPYAHTSETLQKQRSEQLRLQQNGMDESGGEMTAQERARHLAVSKQTDHIVPDHVELPLLSEHLWSIIAESATRNLDPLHPELIIIYDYLAQVQILKRRSKKAKAIWYYCYELSKLVNSRISRETYRIKRLVTHTPRTIAQLQHHYQTIDELYQQMVFHEEDAATLDILKQFTMTAIDSDTSDDDDEPDDQNGPDGMNAEDIHNDMQEDTIQEAGEDEDDDADELLLNSALGQSMIQKALQVQQQKQHQEAVNKQQMAAIPRLPPPQPQTNTMSMHSHSNFSHQSTPMPRRASDPTAPSTQHQFSNTFGFSSSQLFTNQTSSTFSSNGFSAFGQQPSQNQPPNPFASISVSGFTSPPRSPQPPTTTNTTTPNPPSTTQPFQPQFGSFTHQFGGFSPGKTPAQQEQHQQQQQQQQQQQFNSALPSDPFAGINFSPRK